MVKFAGRKAREQVRSPARKFARTGGRPLFKMSQFSETSAVSPGARASALIPRWKRVLDVVLILLALPVLLPLMFLIALVIRLVSNGPILFRQERIGHLGRRFMCFKFRTMAVGNDTSVHQGHLAQLMSSGAPMVKMDPARGPADHSLRASAPGFRPG